MFCTINKEARINPGFYYALRMHSFMYSVLFSTSSSLRRTSTSATRLWIETKLNQKGRGNSPFVYLCCMHLI